MAEWTRQLKCDPIQALLDSESEALVFFTRRDLLEESVGSLSQLWGLPAVLKTLSKQQPDGSWKYAGGKDIRSRTNYDQLETYRILGILIEKYGLNRDHQAIGKAAEFLFSCQTDQGDFRGIYGSQYTPNYSAGVTELLIKAGYGEDARIKKAMEWLISIRQDDGGWAIPLRTRRKKFDRETLRGETLEPDTSKPFSHLVTGVVLRAFAAHEGYRHSQEAMIAGDLLLGRFFQRDTYLDRQDASFWTKFSYPFWFTDLLSALDSLSLIGLTAKEQRVRDAVRWFTAKQHPNGLWELSQLRTKDKDLSLWLALAICRVLKRTSFPL